MAIGHLICTYIEDSDENYHDSKGIAINKILKMCIVRWSLAKTPKPTGECTWRLMLHAWPLIAQWLGIVGTRADKSVEDMCWLLCHLYSTWNNDEAIHHCQRVVANFRTHIAPTSASHYLYFFEFVCPTLLPKLGKFELGIFCQGSAESLNHHLKSIFLTMPPYSQGSQSSHPSPTGHDEGTPQPQFSQPELEPQDEGAQATYDPEDAILFEDAFETGLCEVKGEDEMKSTECVQDPTQLAQPHAMQLPQPPQRNLIGQPPFAFPSTSAMRLAQWPHPNTAIVHVPHGSHLTLLLIYQPCYQKMVNAYGPWGCTWPPPEEKEASLKKIFTLNGYKNPGVDVWCAIYRAWNQYSLGKHTPAGSHGPQSPGSFELGVCRKHGTKKSAHTGTKARSKVLRWPRI